MRQKKVLVLLGVFALFLFLTACEELGVPSPENVPAQPAPIEAGTPLPKAPENPTEEQPSETSPERCAVTADCPEEQECIDGECQTLASLYDSSGCPSTCRVSMVTLTTSDGEDYDIRAGQGGYTAAGALAWKIMSTPEYCSGEKPLVPIKFTKKTTGKVLSEEIVTVQEGETTPVIDHPLILNVRFTITVNGVEEECG